MKKNSLKRLVLLEDFVGTGRQAHKTVKWALENTEVALLFCPMLICPDGFKKFTNLAASSSGRLRFDPVVKLGDSVFLSQCDPSDALMNHISSLVTKIHDDIRGSNPIGAGKPPYSPHGFHLNKDTHTGATVVMFSNTPNNSIPLIHFDSPKSDWNPIFPRVNR